MLGSSEKVGEYQPRPIINIESKKYLLVKGSFSVVKLS